MAGCRCVSEPWLATGDLIEQDCDGQLHFLGRKSETIVTPAGLNIHPEDVEAALNQQPGMEASAVVPLESPAGTEAVAVLIFRGRPEQAQAAIDAANASLAEYQRVRRWRLWPQLDFPRAALGKIQRQKITQWLMETVAAETAVKEALAAERAETSHAATVPDAFSALIAAVTCGLDHASLQDSTTTPASTATSIWTASPGCNCKPNWSSTWASALATRNSSRLRPSDNCAPASAFGQPSPASTATHRAPLPVRRSPISRRATLSESRQVSRPASFIRHGSGGPPSKPCGCSFRRLSCARWSGCLLPPRSGAAARFKGRMSRHLLIANHVTAFDAPLVLYALPTPMRRRVAIAMAGDMLEDWRHARKQGNWLLNLLAPLEYCLVTALFNVFPLPRGAGFRRSFAHAGEAMDRGYHVLVFPEGQLSSDGVLQPFRAGIALLARESRARILPIALTGIGELKQRRRGWFRSHSLEIRIGEPIAPDAQLAPEELAKSLHDTIAALLER